MTVEQFDIRQGLYIFEFGDFESDFHSHPLIEIVVAEAGEFSLYKDSLTFRKLKFAIIPANHIHKISSTNCQLRIIMIEHRNKLVYDHLKAVEIDLGNGYFLQTRPEIEVIEIEKLIQNIRQGRTSYDYDIRISNVIEYLNQNDLEYALMIKTLRAIANLSESRLSHLFKSNVGISLKKYLIWSKLKKTVMSHLDSNVDLFSALIQSGFHDQPHFSRSFKNMLGVNPSKAYNSRNVQFLSKHCR